MKKTLLTLAAIAALGLGQYRAQATIYTTEAAFTSAGLTLFGPNDFGTLTPGATPASLSYGPVSGYAYTISAPLGLYITSGGVPAGPAVSTVNSGDTIAVDLTDGIPVTAVGGNFFTTDFGGGVTSGSITVGLSDGSSLTFSNSGFTPDFTTFFGFTSGGPTITSLTVSSGGGGDFPTMDHFYVGSESAQGVPDGGLTAVLLGLSTLASGWFRRKTAQA